VPSVVEDHIATLADRCRHQRHPGEHQPSGAAALRKLKRILAPAESAAPAASVDDKRRRLHPAGGLERSGSF
jgi:hypothetical protein